MMEQNKFKCFIYLHSTLPREAVRWTMEGHDEATVSQLYKGPALTEQLKATGCPQCRAVERGWPGLISVTGPGPTRAIVGRGVTTKYIMAQEKYLGQ